MNREDCRIGMIVEFGRENGQRTKGVKTQRPTDPPLQGIRP